MAIPREGAVDLGKLKADQEELGDAQLVAWQAVGMLPQLVGKFAELFDRHMFVTNQINEQLVNAVSGVRWALMPDTDRFHMAAIAPANPARPDHRWRVYCLACTELAGEYVYPCQVGGTDADVAIQPMPGYGLLQVPANVRQDVGPVMQYPDGGYAAQVPLDNVNTEESTDEPDSGAVPDQS